MKGTEKKKKNEFRGKELRMGEFKTKDGDEGDEIVLIVVGIR